MAILTELLVLLPLIVEAAKVVPAVADLIRRAEAGEAITDTEISAAMAKVRKAVQNWDDTPPG
jgi:hypothetical protein